MLGEIVRLWNGIEYFLCLRVKPRHWGRQVLNYLSSVEQEMVLSFALSITMLGQGFPPSSMLESIMSAF